MMNGAIEDFNTLRNKLPNFLTRIAQGYTKKRFDRGRVCGMMLRRICFGFYFTETYIFLLAGSGVPS